MRRTLKIAYYLLFVVVITAMGIWFCKSDICMPVHKWLFRYRFFFVFRGNREFIINLLVGICTSALFACLGFFMDYFAIKREREDSLFCIYRTLRYRCFERLFYERNSYDSDSEEVTKICEYLRENLKIIMDYRPPLLLLKVKFYKFFHKLTRSEKMQKQQVDGFLVNIYLKISMG